MGVCCWSYQEDGVHSTGCYAVTIDKLVKTLQPFAALLQEHNDKGDDSHPIFGINNATITLGDLRRAQALIKQLKEQA